jgi:hypothetical protein
MLAALLAVALIALTVLALLLAGAVTAAVSAIVLVNVLVTVLCSRVRALRNGHAAHAERWRPSSFRLPPEPTSELDEGHEPSPSPSLTIHRR